MIIANIKDLDRYSSLSNNMDKACQFLQNLNLDSVKVGSFDIDDNNVNGSCIEYVADGVPGKMFENHENYIDIHLTVAGIEQMAISSYDSVQVIQYYDEEKDIAFFQGEVEQLVKLYPGNCLVTFPEDLHQPKVRYDDNLVRKVVLKVKI